MGMLGNLWNLLILLGKRRVTDFLEEGLSPRQVGNLPHLWNRFGVRFVLKVGVEA
jgi:hypothetical protein